jgi:hypothetical protein
MELARGDAKVYRETCEHRAVTCEICTGCRRVRQRTTDAVVHFLDGDQFLGLAEFTSQSSSTSFSWATKSLTVGRSSFNVDVIEPPGPVAFGGGDSGLSSETLVIESLGVYDVGREEQRN